MFLQDLKKANLATKLIVGIWTKRDKVNQVANGSSMSFGWYDKSYDYLKAKKQYKFLNTSTYQQ